MIVFFGIQAKATPVGDGEFYCPACRAVRSYVRKVDRAYFHVFGIPLRRLRDRGEHLNCGGCEQQFEPTCDGLATANDGERFEAQFACVAAPLVFAMAALKRSERASALAHKHLASWCDEPTLANAQSRATRLVVASTSSEHLVDSLVPDWPAFMPIQRTRVLLRALAAIGSVGQGLGFEENELLCTVSERLGLRDGTLAEWLD